MPARECYKHNLENPKQRGEGAHSYVMRMANLARLAEISSQQAFDDLRGVLDRRVRDNEITTATKRQTTAPSHHDHGQLQLYETAKQPCKRLLIRQRLRTKLTFGNRHQFAYGKNQKTTQVYYLKSYSNRMNLSLLATGTTPTQLRRQPNGLPYSAMAA